MKSDDFFIGWLPAPVRYIQFLRPIILAGLFAFLGMGQWLDEDIPWMGIRVDKVRHKDLLQNQLRQRIGHLRELDPCRFNRRHIA